MKGKRVLMLCTFALLISTAALAQDFAGAEGGLDSGDAVVVAPLNRCFTPVVKRCCAASGVSLSIICRAGGAEWPCTITPVTNDLFKTTEVSATGWDGSVETGNEVKCVYKKVSCGSAVNQCNYEQLNTELICKEKKVAGNLCETPVAAASN